MPSAPFSGSGTPDDPWILKTPRGRRSSRCIATRPPTRPPSCAWSARPELRYHLRCIDDLHAMLKAHGDWMPLGSADEQKPAAEGTVEAWGRARRQSGRRLVRPQEGPARPVRDVRATGARGAGPGRGRAQPAQQPDARDLTCAYVLRMRPRSAAGSSARSPGTPWNARSADTRALAPRRTTAAAITQSNEPSWSCSSKSSRPRRRSSSSSTMSG